jgi:hypothetical protein
MKTKTQITRAPHGSGSGRESGDRRASGQSIRRPSFAAGVALLLMAVLSGFGYLIAVKGLVTPGNATRTASDITAHEGLFRFGVLSLFVVVALDVVVAWSLYRVFLPVSRRLSAVAAWIRTAYASIFAAAIGQLTGIPGLLRSHEARAAASTSQLHVQALRRISSFTNIWNVGLILFGFYLLVLAYLAYRSGFIPRFLSVLLGIAGFAYLFDSVTALTVRASDTPLSSVSAAGEFLFALWLVIRVRRLFLQVEPDHEDPTIAASCKGHLTSSSHSPKSTTPVNSGLMATR